ncbi:MAG: SGNH/GDSL hydrolase family protein [Rikenellaceae bacterium]
MNSKIIVAVAAVASITSVMAKSALTIESFTAESVEVEADVMKLKLSTTHNGNKKTTLSYTVVEGEGSILTYDNKFEIFEPVKGKNAVIEVTATLKKESTTARWNYVAPKDADSDIYGDSAAWYKATKKRNGVAFEFVEQDKSLPNVLIIGTSISIGYTPDVRKILAGKANVFRIPGNSFSTAVGVETIDFWLSDMEWDVIHVNWGLHDLKYVISQERPDVTVEEYKANLKILFEEMTKRSKKVIWANTTYYPDGVSPRRDFGDDAIYNKAAEEVLRDFPQIVIDDHYTLSKENSDLMQPINVHFKAAGYRLLAEQVCRYIEEALK